MSHPTCMLVGSVLNEGYEESELDPLNTPVKVEIEEEHFKMEETDFVEMELDKTISVCEDQFKAGLMERDNKPCTVESAKIFFPVKEEFEDFKEELTDFFTPIETSTNNKHIDNAERE